MKADANVLNVILRADTGAEPALVVADDGHQYWLKPLGNPHGHMSLLAERVVGVAGEWLGAPIAPSRLLQLSPQLAQAFTFSGRTHAQPGFAHGSRLVASQPLESPALDHASKDDNARRSPFYIALWEWCAGEDEQFLYATEEQHSVWSIDHGMWIGGQGEWDISSLVQSPPFTPRWTGPLSGLSCGAFLDAAARLDQFGRPAALEVAKSIPLEWGFTSGELEDLANWLYDRAPGVAARMRLLSQSATKP